VIDFAEARRMMVEGQLRTYDVTDLRVLAAALEIPRERFVPSSKQALAYVDRDIAVVPSGIGRVTRWLLKPMVLGKLIQSAEIRKDDHVLDVGCGTGYSSAWLAKLAADVVALEEDEDLARIAGRTLAALGLTNIDVVSGPLTQGLPARGPYDAILLNGSTEIVPSLLFQQLKDGGRLAGVVGRSPIGKATVYRAEGGHVTGYPVFDAVAPLLPGFEKPIEFVF
jgi:protein-L-isoaspartate(D-aspartate) O-methyltransferase